LFQDKTLWRNIYWKAGPKKSKNKEYSELKKIVPFLKKSTQSISIEGCEKKVNVLAVSEALLRSICLNCNKLQKLALINCKLDYNSHPFKNLPQSLITLSLENTQFENLPFIRTLLNSPFKGMSKTLTSLKKVSVINSNWLRKEDMVMIRKTMPHVELIN
jgi:hypothetical protein